MKSHHPRRRSRYIIQRLQRSLYIVPRTGVADTCQTHYGQTGREKGGDVTSQGTRDGPAKHTQRGATDPPRCQAHLPWTQQLCPFPRTCAWDSGSSAATALPHTRRGVSLLGLCPCRIDFSVSLRGSPTKALSPAGAPAAGATARVSPIKRHTRTLDDFETVRMAPPRARAVHGVPEGQTFCPARTNFTHPGYSCR
jgi:hypothetical protein